MGILDEVDGWVFIVLAMVTAPGRLRQLVRARRGGARYSAIPDSVWFGLSLSAVWVGLGVNALLSPHDQWFGWAFFAVAMAALTYAAAVGIVSRRIAGSRRRRHARAGRRSCWTLRPST